MLYWLVDPNSWTNHNPFIPDNNGDDIPTTALGIVGLPPGVCWKPNTMVGVIGKVG